MSVIALLLCSQLASSGARAEDASSVAGALRAALSDPDARASAFVSTADEPAIVAFYAAHRFAPIFTGDAAASVRADALLGVLGHADEEGLVADDYAADLLSDARSDPSAEGQARFDLAATAALLRWVRHVSGGRIDPGTVIARTELEPAELDVSALLERVAQERDLPGLLASYAPQSSRYVRLREALAQLRSAEEQGPWSAIPGGAALHPGERDPRVPALRRALVERGDLEAAAQDRVRPDAIDLFDDELVAALRRFQSRHGIAVDGVVGDGVVGELAITRAHRIAQLVVNLERERWLPPDLSGRHVLVNIAGFELDVQEGDAVRFHTRVVVGRRSQMTPVFASAIRWMELNPYWNVPRSITVKEYLSKLRHDPVSMSEQGYELKPAGGGPALDPTQIDWSRASPDRFPYRLRQRPGPKNALGRIKFVFPNTHDVYLHDTPSRSLFEQRVRAFSHGCIRVQDPIAFALELLGPESSWDETRLVARIEEGTTGRIALPAAVPVFITYRTAFVDNVGRLQLRPDLYGRDELLIEAWTRSQPRER